ncbi:MAG: TVP38/TMEM64 family protein [Thermoleophilaceae bacterium]|nr:TVP38/TMEM64 family protein [Thermoleophilaceae bacterium]
MTPADPSAPRTVRLLGRLRLGPRARLAVLVIGLAALYVTAAATDIVSPAAVRAYIEPYGALAPLLFVCASVGLGLMLVPGPILAGASGLLFGPVLGTAVTLCASVLSASGALLIARRVGREGVERLSGARVEALGRWLERHGFEAVVVARLAPVLPDAPTSYAAGLAGVRLWQIAAGTAVGAAPRAFAYTALGGTLDDLTSPIAIVAVSIIVLAGVVGAEGVRRHAKRSRSARAAFAEAEAAESSR